MKIAGSLSILLFFIFLKDSNAQNIVPNYGFELADSCPTNLNAHSYKYSLGCVGWGQANAGSTDYYNACDTSAASIGREYPFVGVPWNILGFQNPYEGFAYVGINVYVFGLSDYKEYLITAIPALEIDTAYKVTIHISLADSSRYATDAMGVFFTTYGSPNQYTSSTINAMPQIDYTNYGVISDTMHWTTLSKIFIADSAYTNLLVGVFKTSSEMNISLFNDSLPVERKSAYYYIDNVVVEKLSSTAVSSINEKIGPVLYPNPFTEYATLIFNRDKNEGKYAFSLFNIQGQLVEQMEGISSDRVRIERNGLPSGFYYYQVRSSNEMVINGKLIIR